MKALRTLSLFAVLAASFLAINTPSEADAGYRHYYSSWNYYPSYGYYYNTYYYKPIVSYTRYHYHYCIYYPSQPRYVYYYNPIRRVFWGRFDLEGKPGAQYSMLAPKDQKSELKDIDGSAFPTPGPMPSIPDSTDGVQISVPTDLPIAEPKDLPASSKE